MRLFSLTLVIALLAAAPAQAMPVLPDHTYDLAGEITFLSEGAEYWFPELFVGTSFTGTMTSGPRGCDTCGVIWHQGTFDFGYHDLVFGGAPQNPTWNLDASFMYFTNAANGPASDYLFMTIGPDGTGTWGFAAYGSREGGPQQPEHPVVHGYRARRP